MSGRASGICCLAAAFGCGEAIAEPVIREAVSYYAVTGWDEREVRRNIDQLRPTDSAGVRRDAVTVWTVRWRLSMQPGEGGCRIAGVRVTADIDIRLPKLIEPDSSPPARTYSRSPKDDLDAVEALRESFAVFQQKLLAHEQYHSRIGVEASRKIEAALLALPPAADCTAQRVAADATAQKLLDEAAQRNLDYDIATQNGASEGIRFLR
jgi:predicted secreted Zn-dependent protease